METDNVMRCMITTISDFQYAFTYKHVVISFEIYTIFVNTILQKISTNKKHILPFFGVNRVIQFRTRGMTILLLL